MIPAYKKVCNFLLLQTACHRALQADFYFASTLFPLKGCYENAFLCSFPGGIAAWKVVKTLV
jgi:hypothetical protein